MDLICAAMERDDVLEEPRPPAFVATDAASCALVGSEIFTSVAWALFERLDPGCTEEAARALQERLGAHDRFVAEEYDRMVADVEAECSAATQLRVAPTSSLADLKAECKRMGVRVSGTKDVLWRNVQGSIALAQTTRERKLRELEARRLQAPRMPRCPVRAATRAQLSAFFTRSVTASTAKKDYGLSDRELEALPCKLVSNPYYRSAAPMRLYPLIEVYRASRKKKVAQLAASARAALTKKAEAAAKRKQSRAENLARAVSQLTQRLEHAHVDVDELCGANEDACRVYESFKRSSAKSADRVATTLEDMWSRYVELRDALQDAGCEFRDESRLCRAYVTDGDGDIEDIVTTMCEMKFFFECTDYDALREGFGRYDDIDREEASEAAKQRALKRWARRWPSRDAARTRPELPPSLRAWI